MASVEENDTEKTAYRTVEERMSELTSTDMSNMESLMKTVEADGYNVAESITPAMEEQEILDYVHQKYGFRWTEETVSRYLTFQSEKEINEWGNTFAGRYEFKPSDRIVIFKNIAGKTYQLDSFYSFYSEVEVFSIFYFEEVDGVGRMLNNTEEEILEKEKKIIDKLKNE